MTTKPQINQKQITSIDANDNDKIGHSVPAIEVSHAERSVKRNKMEGGDLATGPIVAPSIRGQLGSRSAATGASSTLPSVTVSSGTSDQQPQQQQQLSMIESLAHNLADDALNEALEAYLRRQVQETADETMRAAFAGATGGEL